MSEKRVVLDLYDTLVLRSFIPSKVSWRPGAEPLMQELRRLGWYMIIWTADKYTDVEIINRKYAPGLLGLAGEYYGAEKPPIIPLDFEIPVFSFEERKEHIQRHRNRFFAPGQFGQYTEMSNDEFYRMIDKDMIETWISRGWKLPPLVKSKILVDDRYGHKERPDLHEDLVQDASRFGFYLVDPNDQKGDSKSDAWAERVLTNLQALKSM